MQNETPTYLRNISAADLAPLVAQALHVSSVHVIDWQIAPLGGGSANYAEGGIGVYRLFGAAQTNEGIVHWSIVAKGASGSAQSGSSDPTAPTYWKRETLVYESGLVANLPGELVAAGCFAVIEPSAQESWLWLEDVQETTTQWTFEQYGMAARHLGQFNGAYLTGHPLPDSLPWMAHGRVRPTLERQEVQVYPPADFAQTPRGSRLVQAGQLERLEQLLACRQALLQAFMRLPLCFCHHDAFRRNLLARNKTDGTAETVAIDWAYAGLGRVGEEAGFLARMSLLWMDVAASDAKPLCDIAYEGYLAGLRDSGWRGDERQVRFGYALSVAIGSAWILSMMRFLQNPNNIPVVESIVGHPVDDQIVQLAELQPFFLALGDEAIALASTFDLQAMRVTQVIGVPDANAGDDLGPGGD